MSEPAGGTPEPRTAPETGYAPVNGLQMYYEIHGSGGTPLLLLHGGLFNIDLQFGQLLPSLAASRQVIAADFQAHGRTNDLDRPLTSAGLASDVVGLLQHLGVTQADVFGFSVGGAVALHLAIRHPELVRRLIVSSASFHPDGGRVGEHGSGRGDDRRHDRRHADGAGVPGEVPASRPAAGPAGQARHLRPGFHRLVRRRHRRDRRSDPDHGRGLRRRPAEPHGAVPPVARG